MVGSIVGSLDGRDSIAGHAPVQSTATVYTGVGIEAEASTLG